MYVIGFSGLAGGLVLTFLVGPGVGAIAARTVLARDGQTLSVPAMAGGAWIGSAVALSLPLLFEISGLHYAWLDRYGGYASHGACVLGWYVGAFLGARDRPKRPERAGNQYLDFEFLFDVVEGKGIVRTR